MRKLLRVQLNKIVVACIAVTTLGLFHELNASPKAKVADKQEGQFITIEVSAKATLKPLISEIVRQSGSKVSEGLHLCHTSLQRGVKKVKVEHLVDALPDILSHLCKMNQILVQTARSSGLSEVHKIAEVVAPALAVLEDLKSVFESAIAKKGGPRVSVKDTYNLLEQALSELPQHADMEGLATITRDLVLQGKGIRQLMIETVIPSLAVIDSRTDVIDTELSDCCSKIENDFHVTWTQLNECCDNNETNFTKVLSAVDEVESKVDVLIEKPGQDLSYVESKVDVIDSKVSVIDGKVDALTDDFTSCCDIVGEVDSKVDILLTREADFGDLESKVDVLTEASASCCEVMGEDFAGTWTAIAEVDARLQVVDENLVICCTNNELNFTKVLSAVDEVESKAELILEDTTYISGIDSKVDVLTEASASCCEVMGEDFAGTWTAIAEVDARLQVVDENLVICCTNNELNFTKVLSAVDEVESKAELMLEDTTYIPGIDSKVDILLTREADFGDLESKVDVLTESSASCCEVMGENFIGTWTALDACCSTMEDNFVSTWTALATVDSKVEELFVDFQETWTALDVCCAAMEDNFVSTWTMLGDANDTSVDLLDLSTVDQLDNTQLSIISWLKSIARQLTQPQA